MQPAPFAPPPSPARRLDLPLVGAAYPQMLRTPRWRWWHPVLAWPIAVVFAAVAMFGPMLAYMLVVLLLRGPEALSGLDEADMTDVPFTFVLNLTLALLIGVALLAVALGTPVASRFLHSVEGRVRWRWLARCLVVLLPLWTVVIVASWAMDGARTLGLPEAWPALIAMTLLMTPFQAAGEEYLFRGFVLATLGAWFARPVVGLTLGVVVSSALFAAAHGSLDPWIILDLVGMSIACVYLTWRTGGLEAAVAVHVINNIVVGILGIVTGTVAEGYIDDQTQGSPAQAAISLVIVAVAAALITWQAKREGIARTVPEAVGARP